MTQDHTLLHQYTSQGSHQALDVLVRRHLDLVYSSALRQVRDSHLAEDVTQAVFLILAQRARKIRDGVAVAGWLLAVTRTTAVDAMRKRILDRRHEEALAKPELAPAESASWDQIAPVLDSALSRLPQHERDAIVLRVLENQSLAQVGAELGISEDAAKMRVARALSRLKNLLKGRGITTGAAALTATLASRAVHAAPAHLLAATLTGTAAGTASASVAALVKGALSSMSRATAKLAAAAALALLLFPLAAGAIIWSQAPNPTPRAVPLAAISAAREVEPVVDPIVKNEIDPAAFGAVDLVPDSVGPRRGQLFLRVKLTPNRNISSTVREMATDSSDNIYAAGMSRDPSGGTRGIVREKLSGQSEWKTILDLPSHIICLGIDSADNVYVGAKSWKVFKRAAGEAAFQVAPIDQQAGVGGSTIAGVAADSEGNVYACGAIDGHWVVRKQTQGTGPFITVDDFMVDNSVPLAPTGALSSNQATYVIIVPRGPSAGVYVVGWGNKLAGATGDENPEYIAHWIVRKSTDGGINWTTVDDVVGSAWPVCADLAGNIYVAGTIDGQWTIRKSETGSANSWSVVDNFSPSAKQAVPTTIGTDPNGNVYVVGRSVDDITGSDFHGIVRSNVNGAWHTVDDYQPQTIPAGLEGTPLASNPGYIPAWGAGLEGFTTDSTGRLYLGGWIQGETTGWIVRSADPAQLTPIVKTIPSVPMNSPTVAPKADRGAP